MRKKITVVLSALILFGCVENAEAFLVFDPANFGRNAVTALQTTQMVLQQVQAYQTQLQQYQLQLQNIKNFGSFTWQNMSQTLANLGSAIQTGQSLAYSMSNMDSAFKALYPGYQSPQNYQQSYQNWSTSTLDTVRGALDSISLQASDFASEEQTINALRGLANNPAGQLQAVQMGNMLAGEGVNQLEELRQLEMTQINSQNSYMAYQVQKDQAQQSESNDLINGMNSTYPQYQNQNGFGPMPNFNGQ
jgi:P-type conjugative transfer protein TrbJ